MSEEYIVYCGYCGTAYSVKNEDVRCPKCGAVPYVD
jgi:rubrerythrin